MAETGNKNVVVIGAGPAGLTAAYELLRRNEGYQVTVFEESDCYGGISKTVNYKGNRMDMGGGTASFLKFRKLMNGGTKCSPCRENRLRTILY